jgi:peptidoglycan/xylan/chitin deacetylase (PgdA/CDA1 family)
LKYNRRVTTPVERAPAPVLHATRDVVQRAAGDVFARVTVSHAVFEERVAQFADVVDSIGASTHFLDPTEYLAAVDGRWPPPERARGGVLMTFDDGLLSSYEFIMGELTPRRILTVFFVPTAVFEMGAPEQLALAQKTRFPSGASPREEQYVTIGASHVTALVQAGHLVMPHSHTHADLAELRTTSDFEREIQKPREITEAITGAVADVFAFPYGGRKAINRAAHRWIGRNYRYCFTAIGGRTTRRSDRLLLPRDGLDQGITVREASRLLGGAHDRINHFKIKYVRRRIRRDEQLLPG